MPILSIESMVVIELTRLEEHLGSAASRITSMYSQLVSTACVTARNSAGFRSAECEAEAGRTTRRDSSEYDIRIEHAHVSRPCPRIRAL